MSLISEKSGAGSPPELSTRWDLSRWAQDHAADLQRFLAKRRLIESDIKDVCQEVFLRILRFERHEAIQNPMAYLFRVAANVAHDFKLRQSRWTPLNAEALEELGDAPPSDQIVDYSYRHRALYKALDELPPLMRAALLLQIREDLTYEAIAARLGISHRLVKRTIVRAHALIRQSLSQEI